MIRDVAERVGFARLVALAVTFPPAGGVSGAVYLPVLSMKPMVVWPPTMPLTVQRTAVVALPFTYAVNRRSPPTGTTTDVGDTVTVWALAGAARATSSRNTSSVSRLRPYACTLISPLATMRSKDAATTPQRGGASGESPRFRTAVS